MKYQSMNIVKIYMSCTSFTVYGKIKYRFKTCPSSKTSCQGDRRDEVFTLNMQLLSVVSELTFEFQ